MKNINALSQIEIKKEQLITERLSALVYLDSLLTHKDAGKLGDIVAKMKNTEQNWPCRMSREEWFKVMDDIQANAGLSNLRIKAVEDVHEHIPNVLSSLAGHRAVLFGGSNGHDYVIFRGTGSNEEWEDNARGIFESDTLGQKAAAQFVKKAYKNYGKHTKFRRIIVAGHSKGGNKAQYSAITLPEEYVDLSFSFDGQGFSAAFLEKYINEIEQRKHVIHLISERRGFVHALGFQIDKTTYYTGRRGDHRHELPHGEPIGNFHTPDAMRNTIGNLGMPSIDSPISNTVNLLVKYYLETPKYRPQLEKTALGLTSLMHENEDNKESINAITNILIAIIDLIAESKSFRQQVKNTAFKETDVILATIEKYKSEKYKSNKYPVDEYEIDKYEVDDSSQSLGDISGLAKVIIQNLAYELEKSRRTRINFIKTVHFVIDLRNEFTTDKHGKLSQYVVESVRIILKLLSIRVKKLAPILNLIQSFWHNHKKNYSQLLNLLEVWKILENNKR